MFRKDLFFRLNVLALHIPPLRERKEDIPLLATAILDRITHKSGRKIAISDAAMKTLLGYNWPGNVRELENCLERWCAMHSELVIETLDLLSSPIGAPMSTNIDFLPLHEVEKQAIAGAVGKLDGHKGEAAKLLCIGKTTLYRNLKEYANEL